MQPRSRAITHKSGVVCVGPMRQSVRSPGDPSGKLIRGQCRSTAGDGTPAICSPPRSKSLPAAPLLIRGGGVFCNPGYLQAVRSNRIHAISAMQARIGPLQAFVNNPGVNNPGRQFCRMQKMPPEKPPLLEARNLVRRHPDGRRWLLDDVSLEVHAAARISVTGPSGAGKTLLLRALAMLDPLDGGQLFWKGRPVVGKDVPRFRRDLLYLHQRSAMLQQTVEAALRRPFLLAVHRQRQFDRGRLVGWLGELGRGESFLRKRTDDLSGGETQIVALLRALQLDPENVPTTSRAARRKSWHFFGHSNSTPAYCCWTSRPRRSIRRQPRRSRNC